MQHSELKGAIQSLLFVSGDSITFSQLQCVFEIAEKEIRSVVAEMEKEMSDADCGFIPFVTENSVKLVTNPLYERWVVKLLAPPEEKTLSDSLMETLSVVAYRQPVTRADIESIRGVRCEYAVSQLLKQGFIYEAGRKECIGRPVLFKTTDAFLRRFGIHSIDELPRLPENDTDDVTSVSV